MFLGTMSLPEANKRGAWWREVEDKENLLTLVSCLTFSTSDTGTKLSHLPLSMAHSHDGLWGKLPQFIKRQNAKLLLFVGLMKLSDWSQTRVGRSFCPTSCYQVTTQRLNTNYKCSNNSLGLFPVNSYI